MAVAAGSVESTLWHEFLHAAFGAGGYDQLLTTPQEEALVAHLEYALPDIITFMESIRGIKPD